MRKLMITSAALTCAALAFASSPVRAQDLSVDAVFYNGKFFTGNDNPEIVEAVAVRDGRIAAIGSSSAMRKLASRKTRLVDMGGKTVLPGFNDNHVHLSDGEFEGWHSGLIDAQTPWLQGATTIPALVKAIKTHAAEVPKGEWIEASIAREEWWNDRIPDRWDLDSATSDHPLVINRGPHTMILNSMALAKAGITRNIPQPKAGGWFFKDAKGDLNGRVLESARRLVTAAMPPGSQRRQRTEQEVIEGYRKSMLGFASLGVTSVNVAGVSATGYRQLQGLYERSGEDLPRATVQFRVSPGTDVTDDPEVGIRNAIAAIEGLGVHTGFGNDRFKVGALKMSIDGGESAPDFWSTVPYKQSYLGPGSPPFYGVQRITPSAYYRVAKRAQELGWQIGTHSIGDGAVVMVVDQMEKVMKEVPRADPRFYMHHVVVKPPAATLQKMAKLGFMVASQPAFTIGLGSYAEDVLEGERLATQNPSKSLLDLGIKVSYGSDGAPYGPLTGIYAAVTRKGFNGKVHGPQEAVPVKEAIKLSTAAPAYFTFEEKVKGKLEPGMLADMVVLGEDILTVDPERIREMPVLQTIVGGKTIFDAKASAGDGKQ